jgi:hypothetical protein
MQTHTECDGAVAQVWVSFFYLLNEGLLIAFTTSWCQNKSKVESQKVESFKGLCYETKWHQLL